MHTPTDTLKCNLKNLKSRNKIFGTRLESLFADLFATLSNVEEISFWIWGFFRETMWIGTYLEKTLIGSIQPCMRKACYW